MSAPFGRDEPDAVDDLDERILRIAEAIGRHIAREDIARRSKGKDEISKQRADLDDDER